MLSINPKKNRNNQKTKFAEKKYKNNLDAFWIQNENSFGSILFYFDNVCGLLYTVSVRNTYTLDENGLVETQYEIRDMEKFLRENWWKWK